MTREEKIELLEKEKAYMLSHGGDRQAITLDSAIKALQQESKTGYWIEHEIKDTCRWLTCSLCGYKWINKKENFCPNCGHRMEVYKRYELAEKGKK